MQAVILKIQHTGGRLPPLGPMRDLGLSLLVALSVSEPLILSPGVAS